MTVQLFSERYSRQLTALSLLATLPDSAVLSPEIATDFRQSLESRNCAHNDQKAS